MCNRALLRAAFLSWSAKHRQSLQVSGYVKRARIKLIKKCLFSWKGHTARANERRRKCFLAMLFNRWHLWAEERIEERKKEYRALMHWASALSIKAIHGLRRNAKECKARSRSSLYCSNHFLSPATKTRTLSDSAHLPCSLPHRSPDMSMLSSRNPSRVNDFLRTHNADLQKGSRRSYFATNNTTQLFAASGHSPANSRRYSTSIESQFQRPHQVAFSGLRSFSPTRQDSSSNVRSMIRSRLSNSLIAQEGKANYQPNTSFSATRFHYEPIPMPTCTRNTMDLQRDRNEVATLLNEILTKIERRFIQQPNHYSSYAGCASYSYETMYKLL